MRECFGKLTLPADGPVYLHTHMCQCKYEYKSEHRANISSQLAAFPDVVTYVLSMFQSDFNQNHILLIPADSTPSFYRITLALNNPQRLICHESKKPNQIILI